jgi:hypothetical protein
MVVKRSIKNNPEIAAFIVDGLAICVCYIAFVQTRNSQAATAQRNNARTCGYSVSLRGAHFHNELCMDRI